MAAPIGNEFWRMVVAPTGRPVKFETAELLWDRAMEYFEWVQDNPLYEQKVFNYQGEIVTHDVPKMRAMTEMAFCEFAGISHDLFRLYKKGDGDYNEFFVTSNKISTLIYLQKFEGAAADLLNAGFIGKDIGMVEKQDITSKGKAIAQLPPITVQPVQHSDAPILETEEDE